MEALIAHYGYLAVLIGTFLEGETVLILAGFAAHRDYLQLSWVIIAAFLGTLFGDQLFFYLGRRHSAYLLSKRPHWRPRLERAQTLIHSYRVPIILSFGAILVIWILINTVMLLRQPFDPYPFILLNLVLSCLAALQAPIIMMSQGRQETRDRLHAQRDYQVNLKAELEIRHLHQKIDHLLSHQWERLVEIQEIQMELINEVRQRK
jgi:hypothetical protein